MEISELNYYSFKSEDSTSLIDINENIKKQNEGLISFIIPEDISEVEKKKIFIENLNKNILFSKDHNNIKHEIFNNQNSFNDYIKNNSKLNLIALVKFNNFINNYTISIDGRKIADPAKNPIGNYFEIREYNETPADTYFNVFTPLQVVIDQAIIQTLTNKDIELNINVGKMSKPSTSFFSNDIEDEEEALSIILLSVPIIFLIQSFNILKNVLIEKEKKQEESLITIGVYPTALWLSWEVIYLPTIFIITTLLVLVEVNNFFRFLNPIFAFLLIFFYGLSNFGISIIFTKIFKNLKTAILISSLLFCIFTISNTYIMYLKEYNPLIEKIICILVSPINIFMGLIAIANLKNSGETISFSNIFKNEFGTYFFIMILNVVLYHSVLILCEKLNSRQLNISYKKENLMFNNIYLDDIEKDLKGNEDPMVEVKNIFKFYKNNESRNIFKFKFSRDDVKVLENINFKVYKNEIFGILGHNGAGKSTLIKIMTGILNPSYGEVHYEGLNLNSNLNAIRKNIGICLQDNILYEDFTVKENLIFFSKLKNVNYEGDEILKELNLEEKIVCKTSDLSGGQKRKLCIGLALIGKPKFLFFDEPTTSLDPLSRRKIWELLLNIKKDKVIFLTTHYMDEADILADRKMIIDHGRIRCLGASVYLKNHFKMMYKLNVETTSKEEVEKIILKNIPEAKYIGNKINSREGQMVALTNSNNINNDELYKKENELTCHTWELPMSLTITYPQLFSELEKIKSFTSLKFSLDTPYLEELFVKLTSENLEPETSSLLSNDDCFVECDSDSLNNKKVSLPTLNEKKNSSFILRTLRLSEYKFKLIFRNKTFLFIFFILPVVIINFTYLSMRDELQKDITVSFEEKIISLPEIYSGSLVNYDINGSNLKDSIVSNIHAKTNSSNTIYDHNNVNFTYLNGQEIEERGKNISTEPFYVSSFSGNLVNNSLYFDIYYNESMIHSLPSTVNFLTNEIATLNNINEQIETYSHPLSYRDNFDHLIAELFMSVFACICITLVVSYFGPSIIRERSEYLLKQLKLNGINNKCYWLSNFIVHFTLLFLLCIGILGICSALGIEAFRSPINLTVLLIIQFISCISTILFQYFLSFYFKKESSSYLFYVLINLIPVIYFSYYVFKYEYLSTDKSDDSGIHNFYVIFLEIFAFLLFPMSYIPNSLIKVMRIDIVKDFTEEPITFKTLIKLNNGLLTMLIGNVLSVILYSFMIYYKNMKKYRKQINSVKAINPENEKNYIEKLNEGDKDVLHEYHRIKESESDPAKKVDMPVKVLQVSKEYPSDKNISYDTFIKGIKNKNPRYGEYHISDYGGGRLVTTALKDITLGINNKECFGLIGPNGSGKSSLLNIITYTTVQSVGKVLFDGKENTKLKEDKYIIGYCPQNDSLWKELTLYEHLVMYLYIQGYSKRDSRWYATCFMKYCKIEEHKNKYPDELSGGTRRKLCILIALIGFSNKVILDEPSSGMDPATRRYIWDILKEYMNNKNSSIVLTTHCMEEAELLCHRIGILVNGNLQCIGSPNHLKMKFNDTYILEIQCSDVNIVHSLLKKDLEVINNSDSICEVKSKTRVRYTFTITSNFSEIFSIMERYKSKDIVYDYSFSQNTLEDIFLKFAKLQENQEI
ncbi:P-loop containing nucleoside triphosphate hydrolase protein [Neocallimastix lanati (nom. inval.)]|nr:P-loop containing nucleoside triphosphate hydrolase protein [Neocallimastix sp. JGI-2020a]